MLTSPNGPENSDDVHVRIIGSLCEGVSPNYGQSVQHVVELPESVTNTMHTIPAPQSASAVHGPPKQRPPAQIFAPPTSGRQEPEPQAPQEDPRGRHAGAVVVVLVRANVVVVVDVVVAVDAVVGVVVIVTGDSALTKAATSASTCISIAAASPVLTQAPLVSARANAAAKVASATTRQLGWSRPFAATAF